MRRTVYSYQEFKLLLNKGWADFNSCGKPVVRDKDENWLQVKVANVKYPCYCESLKKKLVNNHIVCSKCGLAIKESMSKVCPICEGKGWWYVKTIGEWYPCQNCNQIGRVKDETEEEKGKR